MDLKVKFLLIASASCILITLTFSNFSQVYRFDETKLEQSKISNDSTIFAQYSTWPSFLTDPTFDLTSWRKFCWKNQTSLPINDLQSYFTKNYTSYAVCRNVLHTINTIYEIKSSFGQVEYPEKFAQKISKMFNNDETLLSKARQQELFFVMNKYSFEHTVYNPLRGRRPIQPPEMPIEDYVAETIRKTGENCDLCNFQNMTAIDPLGRLENRYAYSAANAFKFDQWHSMFMPKNHDITKLTLEELKDVFTLAWKWIRSVHQHSSKHRFATLLWDNLPHGGASQVHPHIHGTVQTDHFYGHFEALRYASERYFRDWKDKNEAKQVNFFRAIQDVHIALNLTVSLNGISVIVPITSRKEFDLIVLAENFDERVVEVIYQILQGYFHRLKQFSFSSCLYLPSLSSTMDDRGVTPVFYRIIPRGQASSLLSEVSSLDLLSIANVNKIPSELYAEILQWF